MDVVPSWADFWSFVQTPVGLGVCVTATVGLLKRLMSQKLPTWAQMVGTFVSENAAVVSVLVALLYSLLVFLIGEYGLGKYFDKVFIIFALAWAASQGAYAVQKAGAMYVGRITDGDASTAAAGPKP